MKHITCHTSPPLFEGYPPLFEASSPCISVGVVSRTPRLPEPAVAVGHDRDVQELQQKLFVDVCARRRPTAKAK